MTKTEYYNLNQWDAGDRVLREDFNEDNAKIDAALKASVDKQHFEQIAELSFIGGSRSITVTLPDIDWNRYFYVHFTFQISATGYGNIYLNDSAAQLYQIGASSSVSGAFVKFSNQQSTPCLLMPHYDDSGFITGLFFCDGLGYGRTSRLVYRDWTTLTVYANSSSDTVSEGNILIRGMR